MKNDFLTRYRFLLVVSDILAVIVGFFCAYVLRVTIDGRPISIPVSAQSYFSLLLTITPLIIFVFATLGLYRRKVFDHRPKELGRLIAASIGSVVLLVTFDFFSNESIFPAKLVPIYACLTCLATLWFGRTLARQLRLSLYRRGRGLERVIISGNNHSTYLITKYLQDNLESGLIVVGVVANKEFIHPSCRALRFTNLSRAIQVGADSLIQTDSIDHAESYNLAINHHLTYKFSPEQSALFSARHNLDLLGAVPIISTSTTPLIGDGRTVKRVMDISLSLILLVVASPLFLLVGLLMKLSSPGKPIFYRQKRLTRFKKSIDIYKFRTMDPTFGDLSPEEAFTKIGRPELGKLYRQNGDFLPSDPRITRLGRMLRHFSLDELPQLLNVLRGDISLVGPRALVPAELKGYEFKSLILSVKSGLTGLAQISGRRDISFEERRKLDIYYVQNWSVWLDLQIMARTAVALLTQRGAS